MRTIIIGDIHGYSGALRLLLENTAQYLPQQYIEDVCNDMGSEFQTEIDRVIFSYVDTTERGKATNLRELVDNRSATIGLQIEGIQKEIAAINNQIIKLETKMTSAYSKCISDSLKKMQETLDRHEKTKPKEVKKPAPSEENEEYQKQLNVLNESIESLHVRIGQTRSELTLINTYIEDTKELIAKIELIEQSIQEIQVLVDSFFEKHGLQDTDHNMTLISPLTES